MASYRGLFKPQKGYLDNSVTLTDLSSDLSNGLIPVGGVIAVMSTTPGAYTHPGGGAIDRGLMLCDGTAIPSGPMAGQNTPVINSDTFLRGSAASGAVGGANSKAIPVAALPPHTHGITVNNSTANHPHPASPNVNSGRSHQHAQFVSANVAPGPAIRSDWDSDGSVNRAAYHQTGGANVPHGHPTGAIPANNAPHDHPFSVGSAGTGSTFNIEPQYVTTIYAIRVV